jgi:hypothetical protein
MIPKILHQTSGRFTPEELRLGRRMQAMHPGWEYRLWTDKDNEELVKNYFPQYFEAFRAIKPGCGGIKSDIARYMYMSAFGGFYFDTDYRMIRPIDEQLLSYPCVLPISRNTEKLFRLGNASLGSQPGHRFWDDLLAYIFSPAMNVVEAPQSKGEQVSGPEALTDVFLAHRELYKDIYLPPRPMFHPALTCGGFTFEKDPTNVAVHLCWGSWRAKDPLGSIRRVVHRKVTSY